MSAGAFVNKEHPPRKQEMIDLLGKAHLQWSGLVTLVKEHYSIEGEWKFYGKNYGWALRFRKGGKALVSFYPNEGFLTAQVVVSPSMVEGAHSMKLRKTTLEAIDRAHPYPEGRWVFLRVNSESDAADVKKLLFLKSPR